MPNVYKLLPNETVMPDDRPVFPGYVYICDSVLTRYEGICETTIGKWKFHSVYKEIRRCNLWGHEGAELGDRVE